MRNQCDEDCSPSTSHDATADTQHDTTADTTHSHDYDNLDLTNLHTHGLEVDPYGYMAGGKLIASDNVLIEYDRGEEQQYEIVIPDNHPPGTFWYHPHVHGSTAGQVSSGLAGALIVEDDNDTPDTPESDRSMLPDSLKVPERTLVFQSIFYDNDPDGDGDGEIANLDLDKSSGPVADWQQSQRRITINGQLVPIIRMRPGEVQRWRMVSAMFKELMDLQLAGHELNEIATDGHYLPKVDTWNPDFGQSVELHAGYRSDVLVKARTEPGTYMLIDRRDQTGKPTDPANPQAQAEDASVVAAVVVEGEPVPDRALPTDAEMRQITYKPGVSLEQQWNDDPVNQDPLAENDHVQTVAFGFTNLNPDGPADWHFDINDQVYPDIPVRELVLDRIDRWDLSTDEGAPHIFHIHINPFQVSRVGPDGASETVWKDTLTVAAERPVTVYTQYERFTGRFVIHCHLLDHEDNGMMQEVEVVRVDPLPPVP